MFPLFRHFQLFYTVAAAAAGSPKSDLPAPRDDGLRCPKASHLALAAKLHATESHILFGQFSYLN